MKHSGTLQQLHPGDVFSMSISLDEGNPFRAVRDVVHMCLWMRPCSIAFGTQVKGGQAMGLWSFKESRVLDLRLLNTTEVELFWRRPDGFDKVYDKE